MLLYWRFKPAELRSESTILGLPANMMAEALNLNRLHLREQLHAKFRRQICWRQQIERDAEQ